MKKVCAFFICTVLSFFAFATLTPYAKTIRLLTRKREISIDLKDMRADRLQLHRNTNGNLEDLIKEQLKFMKEEIAKSKRNIVISEKAFIAAFEKTSTKPNALKKSEYPGEPKANLEEAIAIIKKTKFIDIYVSGGVKEILDLIKTRSKGIFSIWDLNKLPKFGHYLGMSSFGYSGLDPIYKGAIFGHMDLLDWKSESAHRGIGMTRVMDFDNWNMEKDIPALLEHYHTVRRPIYFFLSKKMTQNSFDELLIVFKYPELLEYVHFIVGVDYILDKMPTVGEFSAKLFPKAPAAEVGGGGGGK